MASRRGSAIAVVILNPMNHREIVGNLLDAKRIRALLAEAQDDLKKYDKLRDNTHRLIKSYEERLELLGDENGSNAIPLFHNENMTTEEKPTTYKGAVEYVIVQSPTPMNARQAWEAARKLASTSSLNPLHMTDTVLRDLVIKGRIVKAGRGLYAAPEKKKAQEVA